MPSEQRLHPATLLFELVKYLRNFALPAVFVAFGASRSSEGPGGAFGRVPAGWEFWLLLALVPALAASILRYLTFLLRYDASELVIRSGLFFRNERHVPYSRIQNLDAVQNVFHRLLGVVEVRVETGSGKDEEARLSVLPRAAFDEMRRRVFEGRAPVAPPLPAADGVAGDERPVPEAHDAHGDILLHLPVRELLLCGFLENKGLVLIGAAYGVMWESDVFERFWSALGVEVFGRGFFRDLLGAATGGQALPLGAIAVAMAGVAGLLVIARLISMVWAFVRLYDFRLSRVREDLRIEFGLLTRVAATIPIRRIQTVTIREGPLYRWLARASVRVETAGGTAAGSAGTGDREWVAPLIRSEALPGLLHEIVPGLDLSAVSWQPLHPRAFRRALKPPLIVSSIVTIGSAVIIGWWAIAVLILTLSWAVISTRQYVRHVAWAEHDEVVLKRSGWIWRQLTLARANKIQTVSVHQSPFDRRAVMARVRVDTAGASELSPRVDIPCLDLDLARGLAARLATQAASTSFRW